MSSSNENSIYKKPNQASNFSQQNLLELLLCIEDPIYFTENFVKIQHPIKGSVPFILYPFQREMISAFHDHHHVCVLTGRQLGKSNTSNISVLRDDIKVKIGSLINLNVKEKIIDWIERKLITLSK